ncbi:MAG: hypothetical protein P8182_10440 [Deltaproteobacteria bacterium]
MKLIEKRRVLSFITLGIAALLMVALLSPVTAQAKKPESITIAVLGDLSGPYAAAVGPFAPGTEDGVRYVNEELGGIDGV